MRSILLVTLAAIAASSFATTGTVRPAPPPAPAAPPQSALPIVFISNRDGDTEIYRMNSDGADERIISLGRAASWPAWSPDGQRIAFVSYPDVRTPQIYVMNADGSGVTRLTASRAVDSWPDWSPDGARIVFSRGTDVWVMNADGSGQRRLGRGSQPA